MRLLSVLYCPAAVCGLIFGGSVPSSNAAEGIPPLKAVRFTARPGIDGALGDSAWKTAARSAVPGGGDAQTAVAFLGYDARHIYVAFNCRAAGPEGIEDTDRITFSLNPFATGRSQDEYRFTVTANGERQTRAALLHSQPTEPQDAWQAAVKRTKEGWTAEMAIPWEKIAYPGEGKPVTMAVGFTRGVAGSEGTAPCQWVSVRPNRPSTSMTTARPPVTILSYTAPKNTAAVLTRTGGGTAGTTGTGRLEARLPITPRLTLVGATSPSEDEANTDAPDIDFSYTERLTSERRPFFEEGSAYFRFQDEMRGSIFTPQRIPRFDSALKLYGNPGGTSSVGILRALGRERRDTAMQWRETVAPGAALSFGYVNRDDKKTNSGVWQVQGSFSGGGTRAATDRRAAPSRSSGWTSSFAYARSQDNKGRGERWNANGTYRARGVSAILRTAQTSRGFRAPSGLIPHTNVRETESTLSWGGQWQGGVVRQLSLSSTYYDAKRLDGSFYRRYQMHSANAALSGGLTVRASTRPEQFGKFHDNILSLQVSYAKLGPFQNLGLRYSEGARRGSAYRFVSPTASLRLNSKMTLAISHQMARHVKNSDLLSATLNYSLGNRQNLALRFSQRNGDNAYYLSLRQGRW